MNSTLLNLLTWKDIQEIITEADTIMDNTKRWTSPEAYFTEVLNRLKLRHE